MIERCIWKQFKIYKMARTIIKNQNNKNWNCYICKLKDNSKIFHGQHCFQGEEREKLRKRKSINIAL